jgi:hypothetical protein
LFQFNFFLSSLKTPLVLIFSNFSITCTDLLARASTEPSVEAEELLFFFLPAKVKSLEALFNNLFKVSLRFKYYRALFVGTFSFRAAAPTAIGALFNLSADSRFFLFLMAKRVTPTALTCDDKSAIDAYSIFASNLKPKYTPNVVASAPLQSFNLFMSSLLQIRSILLLASLFLVSI